MAEVFTRMGVKVQVVGWASRSKQKVLFRYDDPEMAERNGDVGIIDLHDLRYAGGLNELVQAVENAHEALLSAQAPPRVVVRVDGGGATVYASQGIDVLVVDMDNGRTGGSGESKSLHTIPEHEVDEWLDEQTVGLEVW